MSRPGDMPAKGSRFVLLASICIVVGALYFAQEVLIPLALAVLFCFLLAPLVTRLERWRMGRVPAVVTVVLAAAAVVVLLGWVVTAQVLSLADQLPQYQGEIVQKVQRVKQRFVRRGGVSDKVADVAKRVEEATTSPSSQPSSTAPATGPVEASTAAPGGAPVPATAPPPRDPVRQIGDNGRDTLARTIAGAPPKEAPPAGTTQTNPLWVVALPAPVSPVKTLGVYLGVVASPLGTAGLVLVFVIFILLQREDLRDRMIRLVGHNDLNVTTT